MTTSPVPSITEELLAELEEKAKAATPGPWRIYCDDVIENHEGELVIDVQTGTDDDATHIAAANPATLLALIAHIRSLEAPKAAYIEWIPMSEQWPPIDVDVLVACAGKGCTDIRTNQLCKGSDIGPRYDPELYYWQCGEDFEEVTHWAPLPAMPAIAQEGQSHD